MIFQQVARALSIGALIYFASPFRSGVWYLVSFRPPYDAWQQCSFALQSLHRLLPEIEAQVVRNSNKTPESDWALLVDARDVSKPITTSFHCKC